MRIIKCQKVFQENSLSTTQCTVLVMKYSRAYGCQNLLVQHKVQNVGMKKGQGLRLLKLP